MQPHTLSPIIFLSKQCTAISFDIQSYLYCQDWHCLWSQFTSSDPSLKVIKNCNNLLITLKQTETPHEWMNEWMNEWMHEWMNEWLNEWEFNNHFTSTKVHPHTLDQQNEITSAQMCRNFIPFIYCECKPFGWQADTSPLDQTSTALLSPERNYKLTNKFKE